MDEKDIEMLGKFVINSPRIDGIQLLEDKFPSLTRRQVLQLYDKMRKDELSLEDVKKVNMLYPMAEIGQSFGITLDLNS